jgi:uncharacterized protein
VKYLIIFLIVLAIAWRWRASRDAQHAIKRKTKPAPPATVEMVACTHCGVHIPAQDAITGTKGIYCKVAHRQQMEP